MNDLRFACRQLRKSPAFTGVATLTLALGIGANTALFSIFKAIVLQPLPDPDSLRLLRVWKSESGARECMPLSGPDYLDLVEQAQSPA